MYKNVQLLDNVVKQMIQEHEGGEIFFDNLDKALQARPFIDTLLTIVKNTLIENYNDLKDFNIVVSGKFGRYFYNCYESIISHKIFIVNGGLREGDPIDNVFELFEVKNTDFIFLDDSFYSGKTRDVIKNTLKKQGANLLETFVIYDGSKSKDKNVHSLYRYYDNIRKG